MRPMLLDFACHEDKAVTAKHAYYVGATLAGCRS